MRTHFNLADVRHTYTVKFTADCLTDVEGKLTAHFAQEGIADNDWRAHVIVENIGAIRFFIDLLNAYDVMNGLVKAGLLVSFQGQR